MALITCPECGKEFSDKAPACPECGCPIDSMDLSTPLEIDASEEVAQSTLGAIASSAVSKLKENRENAKHIKKIGIITINELDNTFKIHGAAAPKKKSGLVGGMFKGAMAVSTMGLSVAAGKALGGGKKVGSKEWYSFDELVNYELLEDDSLVTSGGVGQALIGGALFGGFGAAAGGITGKRIQKKKIESLFIKVTLNSFETPCIMIPLITKPTKTNSSEYKSAFQEAHQILSTLDAISHNQN